MEFKNFMGSHIMISQEKSCYYIVVTDKRAYKFNSNKYNQYDNIVKRQQHCGNKVLAIACYSNSTGKLINERQYSKECC